MSVGPLGAFPPELDIPARQLDPHAFFAEMHANGPIRWEETRGCWDVFGYDAVKAAANDHEHFSVEFAANPDFVMPDDGRLISATSLLYRDPPRHDELRTVVDDYFKPGAIRELEPAMRNMAVSYLDAALDRGEWTSAGTTFDLVESFAYPLPVSVIAELIGVPPADRDKFRVWSTQAVAASGHDGPDEDELAQTRSGIIEYFEDLAERRRADPKDDLISKVLATRTLSEDEMLGFFTILLIAGNVTTTSLISSAVWSLAEADAFDAVRNDDQALERAIEEVIRFRSPAQVHTRYAVAETELAGQTINAGDKVGLWFGAANHDPTVFDEPGTFDIDRWPNPHIGFGHGKHFCLGAHLARLEARVALEVLLDRFERIDVHTDDIHPSGSMLIYGASRMPVTVS